MASATQDVLQTIAMIKEDFCHVDSCYHCHMVSVCEDRRSPAGAVCHVQAEGVIIDFVDTANMDDLPAWQLPQSRPAAGVLMTPLKHIPMVWGSKLGIHARTCQVRASMVSSAMGSLQQPDTHTLC